MLAIGTTVLLRQCISGFNPLNRVCTVAITQCTHYMQDIGDGWWEGQRPNGEVGLFPESYCEVHVSQMPSHRFSVTKCTQT